GNCAVGGEGCACTVGGTCDPGLSCLSSVCVDARGDSGVWPPPLPDAGLDADTGTNPPPPGCVTETYCAANGAATPCPSGDDCNASLAPSRCVRLYCGIAGTSCSEDVQCELGLACGPSKSCTTDLTTWFVGVWTWTSGTRELVCGGVSRMV